MIRAHANIFLHNVIGLFLTTYQDVRYIQALWALDIIDRDYSMVVDRFYEEPVDTIRRCSPSIQKFLEKHAPHMLEELKTYL